MTWQPGHRLALHTERFTLRSMTREDVDEPFIGWLADPEVMLGLNMPRRRLSRAQAVAWVLAADHQRRFVLGVQPRAGGALLGCYTVDVDPEHGWAETAVVIGDKAWWGRHTVIETRGRLLAFLFDEMGLHKVIGRPHGRNLASIFNYQALGFRCEGVLREQVKPLAGEGRLDLLVFGLLRQEWQARRAAAAAGAAAGAAAA